MPPRVTGVYRGSFPNKNVFRVAWEGGRFPSPASNCSGSAACASVSGVCVCDTSFATRAVFTDAEAIPSKAQLLASLSIGAPAPDVFDAGVYTLCATTACAARRPEVELWTRGGGAALGC